MYKKECPRTIGKRGGGWKCEERVKMLREDGNAKREFKQMLHGVTGVETWRRMWLWASSPQIWIQSYIPGHRSWIWVYRLVPNKINSTSGCFCQLSSVHLRKFSKSCQFTVNLSHISSYGFLLLPVYNLLLDAAGVPKVVMMWRRVVSRASVTWHRSIPHSNRYITQACSPLKQLFLLVIIAMPTNLEEGSYHFILVFSTPFLANKTLVMLTQISNIQSLFKLQHLWSFQDGHSRPVAGMFKLRT